MEEINNYTLPRIVKGKKPTQIPKGSSLEKEWAKNVWYVNFTFNGKQYRIKEGINRIKDYREKIYQSEVIVQSLKNDLKNGYDPSRPKDFGTRLMLENLSIEDAVEEYIQELRKYARPKTVGSYQSKLRYMIDFFPNKQVKTFTSNEIQNYIYSKIHSSTPTKLFLNNKSYELSRVISWTPNTVRSAKGIFRAFFQWCIIKNYYKGDNPVSKIEAKKIRSEVTPEPRHIPFSQKDINMVMNYLDLHDKQTAFFCRFIYSTCLRPNEISKLRIKDVDLEKGQIVIPLDVTKNTKKTTVDIISIEPNFMREIKKLNLQSYPKDYFLTTISNEIVGPKSIGSNRAYKRFKAVLKILKLTGKGYTLYSFKHYSNIQRLLNGWNLAEIMVVNRHSSIAMTEKYLKNITRDIDISQKEFPAI